MRILVVLGAALLLALAAYAQGLTVKVTRLAGAVEVRTSGETGWTKATLGQILQPGDTLRTLKGGKVQLLFPQNTLVLIKENSVLNVKDLREDGSSRAKTLVGSFLFNLQEALSPGSTFEVETPSALAVVRGTRLGVDVDFDGTSEFTGYDGSFEVIAEGVTRTVGPGEKLSVSPGEPPGEPSPTEESWEEAAEDAELPEGVSVEEALAQLDGLCNDFRQLAQRMQGFYDEYVRYEADGDRARMSFVYYNVQPIIEQTEALDEEFSSLMEDFAALLDSLPEDQLATANALMECVRTNSAQIHEQYNEIEGAVSAFTPDLDELLEQLGGSIESRDPARDIRYGSFDTDNDGIPDIVEFYLTGETSYDGALIILLQPDDGEEFDFPDDRNIFFEFEAVNPEYFSRFELHLEAGGHSVTRTFVGTSMELEIDELIEGPGSPFVELLSGGDDIEFTWFVRGYFDFDRFMEETADGEDWDWSGSNGEHYYNGHHPSAAGRVVSSSLLAIDSETRSFSVHYPVGEISEFWMSAVSPSQAMVGDVLRLRIETDGVTALHSWEIVLSYDPSVVEFNRGYKGGLTSGTTLFFGDEGRGQLTISGQTSGEGDTVNGGGTFAELEFTAQEAGLAMFDFTQLNLFSLSGRRLQAIGEGIDVEIAGESVPE